MKLLVFLSVVLICLGAWSMHGVKDKPSAAPKPAAKPAPAAAPKPAPKAAPAGDEVLEAVKAWAQAWSRKDVDAYLGFYARDFSTPKGQTRADWEKQRRQRILAPKSIEVSIDSARVSREGDAAKVSFRQGYKSDTFSSRGSKTLVMSRSEDGRWRIRQEQVGN